MTVRPLDHDFPLRSPLSVRGPREVEHDELLLELKEELDRRVRIYPGMVERDTLKAEDAAHHLAVWRALIDDHHRAEAAIATLCHGHHPVTAGPYVFDWPTRIRELRRELALRRAAYPKWVASAANPLTATEAARKSERLDALHYRYWAQLFAFSPPEIPRDRDPARAAWAAAAERRRQADAWKEALWYARVAPGIDTSNPFTDAAAEARHRMDCWRVIEGAARIATGEDLNGLAMPDHRDMGVIATEARRRADEALDQVDAKTLPEAILGQLEQVARWLSPHFIPAGLPAIDERIAA